MKATVVYNKVLSQGYFRMRFQCPEVSSEARPGTFLTLRVSELREPLLRRPFTIYAYDTDSGWLDIVYKVVGVGTWLMSEVGEGEKMDILGPLGNGFTIPRNEKKILLAAGGTGVAALYSLAQSILAQRHGVEITLLTGGAGSQDIICVDDFEEMGVQVLVATEDGSMGEMGLLTDLLGDQLEGSLEMDDVELFSAGPREMLKKVARLAETYSIPCTVSLEGRMGCGIGACLGCVIRVFTDPLDVVIPPMPVYRRICRDGPVFDAAEIDWDSI